MPLLAKFQSRLTTNLVARNRPTKRVLVAFGVLGPWQITWDEATAKRLWYCEPSFRWHRFCRLPLDAQ
jgi:hypothetical protein